MEAALRERRIRRAYLLAAEQRIRDLVRQQHINLDDLIISHNAFIRYLNSPSIVMKG